MKVYDRNGKKGGKYTIGGVTGNWRYSPEDVEVTRASLRSQRAAAEAAVKDLIR